LTRDSKPASTNPKYFTPSRTGPNYDLGPELSPLGATDRPAAGKVRTIKGYGVQGEVSVVSGLQIPAAEQGQKTVPGGRGTGFHGSTAVPLTTGNSPGAAGAVQSPSADQIIAAAIGGKNKFPAIHLQIQPYAYIGGSNQRGQISFTSKKLAS